MAVISPILHASPKVERQKARLAVTEHLLRRPGKHGVSPQHTKRPSPDKAMAALR